MTNNKTLELATCWADYAFDEDPQSIKIGVDEDLLDLTEVELKEFFTSHAKRWESRMRKLIEKRRLSTKINAHLFERMCEEPGFVSFKEVAFKLADLTPSERIKTFIDGMEENIANGDELKPEMEKLFKQAKTWLRKNPT